SWHLSQLIQARGIGLAAGDALKRDSAQYFRRERLFAGIWCLGVLGRSTEIALQPVALRARAHEQADAKHKERARKHSPNPELAVVSRKHDARTASRKRLSN